MRTPTLRTLLAVAAAGAIAATAAAPAGAAAAADPYSRFGLGFQPAPASMRKPVARATVFGGTVVPTSVDLTENTLTPGNQGSVGSCVSWAIAYAVMGWYSKSQPHAGQPYAPMYVYSQTHLSNTADGGGSYFSAAYNVVNSQGVAPRAGYTQGDYNFMTKPTEAQIGAAAAHKGKNYSYLFWSQNSGATAENSIKAALAAGKPVTLGIPVYGHFFRLNGTDSLMKASEVTGGSYGGHAIAAFGYDANGVLIQNSWGTGWGKGGFATLDWEFVRKYVFEATTLNGFATPATVPTAAVTELSQYAVAPAGGEQLTVRGTSFASVNAGDSASVQLVSTSNPSIVLDAPVISRTVNSLTVRVPAAGAANGTTVTGAYRVLVKNAAGAATDTPADDITYGELSPVTAVTTKVPAAGGRVLLSGNGFGANAKAFAAAKWTFTANGAKAAATWVSDTQLALTVPAGVPGGQLTIVTRKGGAFRYSDGSAEYVAVITKIATATEKATGQRTLAVVGSGFTGSTGWTLTKDGETFELPTAVSRAALAATDAGVTVTTDKAAVVRLPRDPGAGAGVYTLSFTPNATTYPGSEFGTTTAARITYAAPKVTKVTKVVRATGGAVTITGTDFATVDPAVSGAVRLVKVSDPSISVAATVTSRTPGLIVATFVAPKVNGVAATGAYRVVVTSALGTSSPNGTADVVTVSAG